MSDKINKMELIAQLQKIPTGNISDAMDKLKVPRGVITGLQPLSLHQPRTAGFALTIKQMPRHQAAENGKLTAHLEAIDDLSMPGDVIVFDVGGRLDVCTCGALLALRAQIRGVSGFVVNGCVRDVKEIVDLQFPVHCCGASPVKSAPALQTVGINLPVQINEVQIRKGDIIVADDSGVIALPFERTHEVLHEASAISKREERYAALLRKGMGLGLCKNFPN